MSAGELRGQLERLVDRLRGMSLARLEAPYAPEPTRVAAATQLAQRLADAAAALEATGPWREVPQVSAAGVGDLVAVTGRDVLAALPDAPQEVTVRGRGRCRTEELETSLADDVRELRLRL